MKFGIQINATVVPIQDFLALVREAEDAGFDHIFLTDGLSTHDKYYHDPFPLLALCAGATHRAKLGTCVTNFTLRHPVITAQATCSIDELSNERAALGIGSGDTPVYTLGHRMATLAEMEVGLRQMRAFIDGEPITVVDARQRVVKVQSTWRKAHLPVYLAADGPKTLRLGGRLASGVICGTGVTPDVAGWALAQTQAGLAEAGRAADGFPVWLNGFVQIAETPAQARAKLADRLLTRVHHNLRREPHAIAPERLAEVARFRDEYDDTARTPAVLARNMALLTDYLWERFSITGPVTYCLERFQALEAVGVKHFIVAGTRERHDIAARRDLVKTFGKSIIARLGS